MAGVRVIDAATHLAAPSIAAFFGDHGADVIKIEHPEGDELRKVGPRIGDASFYWKIVNRNKRLLSLRLSTAAGADVFRRLAAEADVVIENFRPGTMERWGLGWDQLHELNPRLVMVRVTGFGQTGPYAARPAFGTVVEAYSGFASMNGEPSGPPLLPPVGLGDQVCGMNGAWMTAFALYHRDVNGGSGQVIDLPLYEPMLSVLAMPLMAYDRLGIEPTRHGNSSPTNSPRNIYATCDDRWIGISTSSARTARSALTVVGHPEVCDEPWFATGAGRADHRETLDAMVGNWIAERTVDEAMALLEEAAVPAGVVNDIPAVIADPHMQDRSSIITLEDDELGNVVFPAPVGRWSETPGRVAQLGRARGSDTEALLEGVGLTPDERRKLRDENVC